MSMIESVHRLLEDNRHYDILLCLISLFYIYIINYADGCVGFDVSQTHYHLGYSTFRLITMQQNNYDHSDYLKQYYANVNSSNCTHILSLNHINKFDEQGSVNDVEPVVDDVNSRVRPALHHRVCYRNRRILSTYRYRLIECVESELPTNRIEIIVISKVVYCNYL
jgi:hypothetical protein